MYSLSHKVEIRERSKTSKTGKWASNWSFECQRFFPLSFYSSIFLNCFKFELWPLNSNLWLLKRSLISTLRDTLVSLQTEKNQLKIGVIVATIQHLWAQFYKNASWKLTKREPKQRLQQQLWNTRQVLRSADANGFPSTSMLLLNIYSSSMSQSPVLCYSLEQLPTREANGTIFTLLVQLYRSHINSSYLLTLYSHGCPSKKMKQNNIDNFKIVIRKSK